MLKSNFDVIVQVGLCDNGAFYGHIQNKHDISYREYKEKYGRCETESQPFECKICGKVIKYDRNTVHTHLKNVHGINWTKYLDRIRKLRRGLEPEPLPVMKMVRELKHCHSYRILSFIINIY